MKKYFFLGMLCLVSVSSFANKIKTAGRLGQASANCKPPGVCYASTSSAVADMVTIYWELNSDQTVLTMTISDDEADKLSSEGWDVLHSGSFTMYESFTFPSDVTRALGAGSDLVLPAGKYTVTHANATYTINFRLP